MLDVLHELLLHDHVCAVKLNPANDYVGSQMERALAPLHARGFFRCLYGGPETAQVPVTLCTLAVALPAPGGRCLGVVTESRFVRRS